MEVEIWAISVRKESIVWQEVLALNPVLQEPPPMQQAFNLPENVHSVHLESTAQQPLFPEVGLASVMQGISVCREHPPQPPPMV